MCNRGDSKTCQRIKCYSFASHMCNAYIFIENMYFLWNREKTDEWSQKNRINSNTCEWLHSLETTGYRYYSLCWDTSIYSKRRQRRKLWYFSNRFFPFFFCSQLFCMMQMYDDRSPSLDTMGTFMFSCVASQGDRFFMSHIAYKLVQNAQRLSKHILHDDSLSFSLCWF